MEVLNKSKTERLNKITYKGKRGNRSTTQSKNGKTEQNNLRKVKETDEKLQTWKQKPYKQVFIR